jgi:hypothetical protein
MSALSWARKGMASSNTARTAFLVFTWQQIVSQVTVGEASHMPGVNMGDVDSLSRFRVTSTFTASTDAKHLISKDVDTLVRLCNPLVDPWGSGSASTQFTTIINAVVRVYESLKS